MFEDDDDDGGKSEGAPAWMATFADMATLLLTFFVLMLSFANMDVQDFKMALGSVRDALGVKTARPGYFEGVTTTPVEFDGEPSTPAKPTGGIGDQEAIAKVVSLVKKKNLADHVEVTIEDDNIVMTIYDQFRAGSAVLEPKNFEELDLAVGLSRDIGTAMTVEAHTDDRPIHSAEVSSNWALSALRAGAVARYMIVAGGVEPSRMSVAGYADIRPKVENDSPENRARNRRVRIVLARRTKRNAYQTTPGLWRP